MGTVDLLRASLLVPSTETVRTTSSGMPRARGLLEYTAGDKDRRILVSIRASAGSQFSEQTFYLKRVIRTSMWQSETFAKQ
jgi:hypothetical protein